MNDNAEVNEHHTVAVIIPTYRRPKLLVRAVESALAQDYPGITQIIITQDGDDAETQQVAQRFVQRDARVQYSRNLKHKRGPCGNKNNGLDLVTADYVVMLDDDDYFADQSAVSKLSKWVPQYDVVLGNCMGSITKSATGRHNGKTQEVRYEDLICSRFEGEYTILFRNELRQGLYFPEDLPGFEHLMWWVLSKKARTMYVHDFVKVYNQEGDRVTASVLQNAEAMAEGYIRTVNMFGKDLNAHCPKVLLKYLLLAMFYSKHCGETSRALKLVWESYVQYKKPSYLLALAELAVPNPVLRSLWSSIRRTKTTK